MKTRVYDPAAHHDGRWHRRGDRWEYKIGSAFVEISSYENANGRTHYRADVYQGGTRLLQEYGSSLASLKASTAKTASYYAYPRPKDAALTEQALAGFKQAISKRRDPSRSARSSSNTFRTRATFLVKGRWIWRTWTNTHANKHAAIREKANELGADAWDYGQADHEFSDRAGF